jgi:DNA-binding MarR family transcriptional regulator
MPSRARPGPSSEPPPSSLADDYDYSPDESVGYLVRRTFRCLTPLLQAQLATERVTVGMWYFLRVLWWRDGLTQRELTERVETMQPTTVLALRSMERRGLVSMEKDKWDKRRVRIFLTVEGRSLKKRLMPRVAAINEWVLAGISPNEAAEFIRTLKKIRSNSLRAAGNVKTKKHRTARQKLAA